MLKLKAENITKSFGGEEIIKELTVELNEKEIVSLLGVSGRGKTTLFSVLSGLSVPDEGEVYLQYKGIAGKPGKIS